MMTRGTENRRVRIEDSNSQTLTCNAKGMRNGKCEGMNGGRHLPEAHAGFSLCVARLPPLTH